MSIIPPSIIKTYAESLGITNLNEEVTTVLAQDLEYRVRQVVQEASKYMHHAHRPKLTTADINYALEALHAEKLYGYDPAEGLSFKLVPNSNIFYVPKEEVDLEELIQQPLPKAPQPITLTSHWLAVDGVQPMIPENPNLQEPDLNDVDGGQPASASAAGVTSRKEVQEDAEIKPLVKHVLSKELQAYFDTVISDITSPDPDRIKTALYSVATDSGLQQLLPYFIQFVAEMVPKNLRNLSHLQIYIGLVGSLLANEHIFVEPYLHQVMPPLLSCLLGKRLCEDPEKEDHWSLRDRCAHITAELCRKFGTIYATLVPRVTKTLAKTLSDPTKPVTSHYGAIVGIAALGPYAVENLIMPSLESYLAALNADPSLGKDESKEEVATPAEISKCKMALKGAVNRWVNEAYSEQVSEHSEKRDLVKRLFNM